MDKKHRNMMKDQFPHLFDAATKKDNQFQQNYNFTLSSLNKVADPWMRPERLPFFFSKDYFYYLGGSIKRFLLTNLYFPWQIRRYIKKDAEFRKIKQLYFWKKSVAIANFKKLYIEFRKQYASGEISDIQLRNYCSEIYAKKIRNELNARAKNPNLTIELDVKDTSIRFLNLQVIVLPPPVSASFVQVTTRITSFQEINLKDNRNNKSIIQSSVVIDHIVFERLLTSQESEWKMVDSIIKPKTFERPKKKELVPY